VMVVTATSGYHAKFANTDGTEETYCYQHVSVVRNIESGVVLIAYDDRDPGGVIDMFASA